MTHGPTAIWSALKIPAQAQQKLYLGDRGSGKTTALISRLCALLKGGVPPESILVLAGHRQQHVNAFREAVLESHNKALGNLNIWAFPAWGLQVLERYSYLHSPQGCLLLQSRETLFLIQRFHMQNPEYFDGRWCPPHFYEQLFRRYRRCGENLLTWEALHERTAQLETDPLALEANRFLKAFQTWIQQHPLRLLDPYSQMQELATLSHHKDVGKEFAGFEYWLIDDLDETRPIEQLCIENLSQNAKEIIYSANPQGGIERLMGANPDYLTYLQNKKGIEIHTLEKQSVLFTLAQKFRVGLAAENMTQLQEWPYFEVKQSQHPTEMLENCSRDILERVQAGASLDEMLCVTWQLDDLSTRQLQSHFEHLGLPVQIYRGGSTLQRHPLINALLTLLRLVRWQALQKRPHIAQITSFDMAQLLRLCGESAFDLAQKRFELGENIELWGAQLKTAALNNPGIEALQQSLKQLRQNPESSLYEQALHLWRVLLTHLPETPEDDALQAVHSLLKLLERHAQLQMHLPDPEGEWVFLQQLLAQSLWDAVPVEIQSKTPVLRVMTLFRLCELGFSSRYQFWLNLSSPDWNRPINHPLDNALLLSPSWPLEQSWTLAAEDHFVQSRLSTLVSKGIQYCQERPYFYASRFDRHAKLQGFERLIQILETTEAANGFTLTPDS